MMKKFVVATATLVALLGLTACGEASADIPEVEEEYVVDGTETVDYRMIDEDVYVTVVKHGEVFTNPELEEILEETEGAVTEGNFLFITTYDLDQSYEFKGETKYREGYSDINITDLFAPSGKGAGSFDFEIGNYNPYTGEKFEVVSNRITIPYESLKVYYDEH